MGFIQTMDVTTSRFEEIERLHEQWMRDTECERTVVREQICRERDRPDTCVIIELDSCESAMTNSELAETATIAEAMAELVEAPTVFRNLDLIGAD